MSPTRRGAHPFLGLRSGLLAPAPWPPHPRCNAAALCHRLGLLRQLSQHALIHVLALQHIHHERARGGARPPKRPRAPCIRGARFAASSTRRIVSLEKLVFSGLCSQGGPRAPALLNARVRPLAVKPRLSSSLLLHLELIMAFPSVERGIASLFPERDFRISTEAFESQ
jgi:hypothetical protein